jgi:tRNA-specific 2-thiouridylase
MQYKKMKERVVVGMSGGVDSSVAAALLIQAGYEVIGLTLRLDAFTRSKIRGGGSFSSILEDSIKVAKKLGIKHHILNPASDFRKNVVLDFCREYLKGRTPNPCVKCNRYIKFETLLKKASCLGARFVATGHYCRILKQQDRYLLKKAKDRTKDQSYFLYRLTQSQLKHILFPLGSYTKIQVRAKAKELSLPVFDKPESQDICFLKNIDYRRFIKAQMIADIKPGPILDNEGKVLGKHKGIPFYTIGQRQGLGIALGYPAHVSVIDPKNNRITVGPKKDCYKKEFLVKKVNFISSPVKKKIAVRVRIRYNHQEGQASIMPEHNKIRVRFARPQFAITCGQSAVFYDGDIVLGGGIIDKVIE